MIFKNGKKLTPAKGSAGLLKIMMNGSQIWPEIQNEIPLSDTKAGDVLLWDKTSARKLFVSSDSLSSYPSDSYTPIGIVVIPASHDVYGDGSCGVMSLKPMNCSTPSTGGTSDQSMYWGEYGTDISSLTNYNVVCHIGDNGNPQSTIQGTTNMAYLPSDKFDTVQCPHDTDAYYNGNSYYIPSPYLTNGERNPLYYQTTSPSSANNAMSDFDGIGNTEKIITQRGTKDYNSWKPTYNSQTDYPAASCCDMFYTEGTSQGDWYLPACGELGYIMTPFNKINDAIGKMRTAYGSSVGIKLDINDGYWSSTEYSSSNARGVYTYNGNVNGRNKNTDRYVRAFLKVSSLDMSGIYPESASNGVYVYANNGKLYNPDDWNTANNNSAVGVAVIDDNCKFAITKGEKPRSTWSDALYGTNISGLTNYNSSSQAVTDFNGENNTAVIRAAASSENSSNNAAHYCYNQTVFISGRGTVHGYLPALGELQAAYNNKSAVDSAMSLIGGIAMPTGYYLWSSTECNSNGAWTLDWNNSAMYDNRKDYTYRYAVPVFPLISSNPEGGGGIDPESAQNGVYIYKNDGKLYDPNEWNTENNENALGVAVVTDNCKFVINKELPMSYGIPWADALHGVDVDGLTNYSTSQEAMIDYSGQSNTDIIRNAAPEEDSSNNAAHYCYAQTLNGQNGYLPSAGELAAMYNNKSEINQSLVLIGSKSIDDRCDEFQTMLVPYLWSSTSYTRSYAYRLDWSDSHISMIYDVKGGAESSCYTFPIFPL